MKIVYVPLDDRPCNTNFAKDLFNHDELEIKSFNSLNYKKNPTDTELVKEFLIKECKDADCLVLSVDMLVYGGLVPSRIHNDSFDLLKERLNVIKELKKNNSTLTIYAFGCIMRCPNYSSDDEEPDYYALYGKQIHDLGEAIHLNNKENIEKYEKQIDSNCLIDYKNRRKINLNLNLETLKLVLENYIDELVIPQDDSTEYGFAAMDRNVVKENIHKFNLENKVMSYPGADEVNLSLVSRYLTKNKNINIYPYYFNDEAKNIIPLYEGGHLYDSINSHIKSCGCNVSSYEESDIVLIVTSPTNNMLEAWDQNLNTKDYQDRNIEKIVAVIDKCLQDNKIITIGDNAYANGGDLKVLELLNENKLLMKIHGYAGWNTSANTMGTALAQGVNSFLYSTNKDFLLSRYIEDLGFCASVRKIVTDSLPKEMDYFDVKETDGLAAQRVLEELNMFVEKNMSSIKKSTRIFSVKLPWKRMFEIDLKVKYINE